MRSGQREDGDLSQVTREDFRAQLDGNITMPLFQITKNEEGTLAEHDILCLPVR